MSYSKYNNPDKNKRYYYNYMQEKTASVNNRSVYSKRKICYKKDIHF